MHGDFTRDTFDPTKHYSCVLMQQGRVMLDADWNEQTSIFLRYLRTLAVDVFGPHAGPSANLGFEIIGNLTDPALQNKLAPLGLDPDRLNSVKASIGESDMLIAPGRYYVDGLLVENEKPILYTEQLGYPFDDDTTLKALRGFQGGMLLYLDVWERDVTFLQDESLREVALGGPDTCSRAQVVWQLRVLRQPPNAYTFSCNSISLLSTAHGTLRAQVPQGKAPSDLCVIPPQSRYRGVENRLYRVEIHRSGTASGDANAATFKWSRDNGSVAFPIHSLKDNKAKLQSLGRDRRTTLNSGDWVELLDEHIVASGAAGTLVQVETPPDLDTRTVTLKPPGNAKLTEYDDGDPLRPMLRRWDHPGNLDEFSGALAVTAQPNGADGLPNGWIELEDGVQIWFAQNQNYSSGDYWLIPARTATGNIEWPQQPSKGKDSVAAALPPRGPKHHYAPIWLSLPFSGPAAGTRRNQDCRCRIERLPCAGYAYALGSQGIGPNF